MVPEPEMIGGLALLEVSSPLVKVAWMTTNGTSCELGEGTTAVSVDRGVRVDAHQGHAPPFDLTVP